MAIRDHEDVVLEVKKSKIKPPPMFKVILLNDDFTPMEFVVEVLEGIFSMQRTRATQVMLEVHTKGKGICGVYSFEIAETKAATVLRMAEKRGYPLRAGVEKE